MDLGSGFANYSGAGEGLSNGCAETSHQVQAAMAASVGLQAGVKEDVASASVVRRPLSVPGPAGGEITLETLPPANTRRWVVRRKAEVIAAIRGGLITAAEACARYQLSPEELELWEGALDRAGMPGLRVTRIQLYRDYPPK